MSDFVLDASLTLQWLLEDESDRNYSLDVLRSLSEKRALVPPLWFYEVGNGLLMAHRRKRVSMDQVSGFMMRLRALPIDAAQDWSGDVFDLPRFAQLHSLTVYDAAYLDLARRNALPLATNDSALRHAATRENVKLLTTQV